MRPWDPITADDVDALIDLTVEGKDTDSMALLQRQGIAAIQQILTQGRAAYLADEVGMGKTYQAMGLAAVVWNDNPDARILFVSPRENLQLKWVSDYQRFFADNYRRPHGVGDDLVASVLFRRPVHRPVKFDRLPDWTESLGRREPMAAFLRHTSFARPVYLRPEEFTSLGEYWSAVQRFAARAGLYDLEEADDVLDAAVTAETIGVAANIAFARAANQRLREVSDGRPYFDLIVFDESQCLRNPGNQTNTILHELLDGQVDRWLFMSATPAHSGPGDIPTVLNHYPRAGQLVDPGLVDDLPAMQKAIEPLMVRRSRLYLASTDAQLTKSEYRDHDLDRWSVADADVGVLDTLAMGLVQKGLVDVLGQRGNRFKIGFLSSFESLQSSVKGRLDRDEEAGDWHVDSGAGASESEAADDDLIGNLVADFREQFDRDLPHPKLDAVAKRLGDLAFGTDESPGGEKVLVFTRRVSTVGALQSRLTRMHRERVEARLARVWELPLMNWEDPGLEVVVDEDLGDGDGDEDPESLAEVGDAGDLIRIAMQKNAWLDRYRRTFRATGRNALFFEDGWLLRLCRAGGVAPDEVARRLPDELWAEAWQHATRTSGVKERRYQAHRLRYLAWHALDRHAEVFGLSEVAAQPWRVAYEAALHEHLAPIVLDGPVAPEDVHREDALVAHEGLWVAWDATFAGTGLELPGADLGAVTDDALLRRQVARSVLGQVLRLSDNVIDLWAADELGGGDMTELASRFLGWASSSDVCAQRLQSDVRGWLENLRTVIDSSLDGSGRSWHDLARQESWNQLYELSPVLGVTGGSGAQQRATQQFRTPGMPRVVVCTDTLKEGVDMHLFCDRVVHYGVAWTAGDQEQRVGRVDRYFSQIERRIRENVPGGVKLEVGYPHVVRTIERMQVERVRERQRHAEQLMDSPLGGLAEGVKELSVDGQGPRVAAARLAPYTHQVPVGSGRLIEAVSSADALIIRDHYAAWHRSFVDAIGDRGRLSPASELPVEAQTLGMPGSNHEVEWSFDGPLQRYVITVSDPLRASDEGYSGGWRYLLRGRRRVDEPFLTAMVPAPGDRPDETLSSRLVMAILGEGPSPDSAAREVWGAALASAAGGDVIWRAAHKADATVSCGDVRRHVVHLYAYAGEFRLLGVVATRDQLAARLRVKATDGDAMLRWARERTAELDFGYVDIHDRDGVVFGMQALHGQLTDDLRHDLVREVAWRADALESVITGEDTW